MAGDFTPGAFDPFSARLPRLLDPASGSPTTGYVAHGLGDLVDRFIVRDAGRWTLATYLFPSNGGARPRACRTIVDAVDPAQIADRADAGQPRARAQLPAAVRQGPGDRHRARHRPRRRRVSRTGGCRCSRCCRRRSASIWAAGVLAIAGVELDLFAVFAVVTFVGIGVDYGIHLVHRYQERGDAERATAELAPVILVAAAITLLGYGTLVWSSYPPLRSIGLVSAVSTVALAAASVLVLPALLLAGTLAASGRGDLRPMRARTAAVIPAFNEAALDRASRRRHPRRRSITSSSSTMGRRMRRRSGRAAAGAEVVVHDANRGKGHAVRTGLARVLEGEFTHVLLLDGDMQHLPEEAASLLAEADRSGADVVLGERRFERERMPASRYHANRIGSRVLSWFVGVPVRGHAVRLPRLSRRRAAARCALNGHRLRDRDRDAGQGPAARRSRRRRCRSRPSTPDSRASCGRCATRRAPVFWRCTIDSSNVSEPARSARRSDAPADRRDGMPAPLDAARSQQRRRSSARPTAASASCRAGCRTPSATPAPGSPGG